MQKLQELFRLKYEQHLSNRAIGQSLKISPATVSDYICRARRHELSWPFPAHLQNDEALYACLYPVSNKQRGEARVEPDWSHIHQELKRHKGVTLMLLWHEYRQAHRDDGYGYSQFCNRYRICHGLR